MLCHCPTNTLRLFLRSVAQVDLPKSAKYVPRRPFQSSSSPGPPRPAFRDQQQLSRRTFSSAGSLRNGQVSSEQVVPAHDGHDEASERGTVASSPPKNESAFAEISLDSIDEILAEARSENPISDGLVNAEVVENDTPASFVASSFSKQREIREKKGKERDIVWRPLHNERVPLNTLVVKEPRPAREDRQDFSIRPDTRDTEQHATFPRLPRVRREPIDTTPLKSRLDKLPARDNSVRSFGGREWVPKEKEHWQIDKEARIQKYPEGWKPQKRLSPDAISGIRALHAQLPEEYHTRKLADTFQVSPEAISRILRTHWSPSSEEEEDRTRRWLKRGESVWTRYAEAGVKPPKKWREAGIGKPDWMINKPTTKKREAGPTPALVTQPRRSGGLYQLGGKRNGSDDGGFI